MRWALSLLLCVACAAPAGPPADPLAGYSVAESSAGMFTAAWRVVDRVAIPDNEPFELDVRLFEHADVDTPMTGAEVVVSGWMPDHGHGMNRRPLAAEVAPGRYRVRGMLFHMSGSWQLFIDVIQGGVSERAQFDVQVE
jgi:hypothetical protein